MNINQLQFTVERYFASGPAAIGDPSAMDAFLELRVRSKAAKLAPPRLILRLSPVGASIPG